MCVSCECCVLSGRGLCDGLIPRPGESYRVWRVWKVWSWSLEKMRRPRPPRGCRAIEKKIVNNTFSFKKCRTEADLFCSLPSISSCTIRGSTPGRGKKFFSLLKRPDRLWDLFSVLFNGYQCSFQGWSDRGMTVAIHLHLVPRLRMSRAIFLLLLYVFVASTGQFHLYSTFYRVSMSVASPESREKSEQLVEWHCGAVVNKHLA
jgi:hypothetical protein